MSSRKAGLALAEQDYQLRRARSQVDIPRGGRIAPHLRSHCVPVDGPWVGKLHRSLSSSDLYPVRRPIVDPPIATPLYYTTWYQNAYKTPWYDRSKLYYWGGYMSPLRYYPSRVGGYSYISSPLSPQIFYPNDWYHKFRSIPVALTTDPAAIANPYSTSLYDYDYLPREAVTGTHEERGPGRAFAAWRMGLLDYATLDRHWLGRDSLYRRLAESHRRPQWYDYPGGSYNIRRLRPWHYYV